MLTAASAVPTPVSQSATDMFKSKDQETQGFPKQRQVQSHDNFSTPRLGGREGEASLAAVRSRRPVVPTALFGLKGKVTWGTLPK